MKATLKMVEGEQEHEFYKRVSVMETWSETVVVHDVQWQMNVLC